MKTIQSKILFVVITALVVITAIVTAIAVTVTHEIIHKDADRILNNVSQKEAAQINEMLNDFVDSAAIMEHYAIHVLDSADSLKEDAYVSEYMNKMRHLFDEIALTTSGTSSYYLCFSPELTGATKGFYSKMTNGAPYELSKEEFAGLSLITNEELIEYSNHSATKHGEWAKPHPSRFTGETVISYIVPVYKDGVFVAILGFNMNFDYLLDRVNSISVYEYGCALLFGEKNQICYNQSKKTEFDGEYAEANTPLVNGMRLELRAAYKDIQSGIRPMLSYIIVAFLAVFVLSILYTVWVTHRIVTPLKKLTVEAEKITFGVQEDINLTVDSEDEVGILSRVLSSTYAKIREYSTYINALAYRDSLTGIKNSTAYAEAIEALNREINLGNPHFGVLVADINNLKKTNDTYGHDVGNELIVRASRILTDTFKTSAVYRIGGDEFAVILKDKDLENYRSLVEKMDAVFSSDFIDVNNEKVPVLLARGVAVFNFGIDCVYTDVFAKADHAMYVNKQEMKAMD